MEEIILLVEELHKRGFAESTSHRPAAGYFKKMDSGIETIVSIDTEDSVWNVVVIKGTVDKAKVTSFRGVDHSDHVERILALV